MSIKVIFDTDPGIDDAFALFYTLAHPEIEVIGITTVFGNVPVEIATENAHILLEKSLLNKPVLQGASKPLSRPNSLHSNLVTDLSPLPEYFLIFTVGCAKADPNFSAVDSKVIWIGCFPHEV